MIYISHYVHGMFKIITKSLIRKLPIITTLVKSIYSMAAKLSLDAEKPISHSKWICEETKLENKCEMHFKKCTILVLKPK